MADVDPFKIVMLILKIIPVIVMVVIFFALFNLYNRQIKSDDLERFSLEMMESVASSELTASRYVFDEDQLNLWNQLNLQPSATQFTELPFLRSCAFAYHVKIENLRTQTTYEFGYSPYILFNNVDISAPVTRTMDVAITVKDRKRSGEFYSTVDPAVMTLTAYDTQFLRATCAVEKAFYLKQTQIVTGCASAGTSSTEPCVSLKRINPITVCYTYKDDSGNEIEKQCRYMPSEINFAGVYDDTTLKTKNIPPGKAVLKFYPVKDSTSDCSTLSASSIAGKDDPISHVLICVEAGK